MRAGGEGPWLKMHYTVGETARLLGVTTQTLRYYDKIGLLRPDWVDPETGYRYYSFNQFHYIDRIKYLQGFGLDLERIREIISSGSAEKLVDFLREQRGEQLAEIQRLQRVVDDIDWYIDYFAWQSRGDQQNSIYKVHLNARWVIAVDCYPERDVPISKMELRLASVKGRPELRDLHYLRQYAYLVDFPHLLRREFWATSYFIYLRERPDFETPYLMELPAGEYLCYRAPILTRDWKSEVLADFFRGRKTPRLVIANEYEDNLVSYEQAQYEIQILT